MGKQTLWGSVCRGCSGPREAGQEVLHTSGAGWGLSSGPVAPCQQSCALGRREAGIPAARFVGFFCHMHCMA